MIQKFLKDLCQPKRCQSSDELDNRLFLCRVGDLVDDEGFCDHGCIFVEDPVGTDHC